MVPHGVIYPIFEMRTWDEVKPQPQPPISAASASYQEQQPPWYCQAAELVLTDSSSPCHQQHASTPRQKHTPKGELHVFLLLIKRGKTTHCWRFSSLQPLPVHCTSHSPASPLLPSSSSQQPGAQHAGRSEPGRGKNSSFSPAGKRKGKNTRKGMPSSTSYQWNKTARLFPPLVWA